MVLHAQGDLLLLLVSGDDIHLHSVAHLHNLRGVLDAAPGQLGDVDHAVHAADVHESAVGSQGLHGAGIALAVLDPDLLRSGGTLGAHHAADGTHHAAAGTVDLGDHQTHLLLEQGAHGSLTGQTGLRGGDEHPDALHRHHDAALVVLGDHAVQNSLVLTGGLDLLPALDHVKALLGQGDHALLIVDADDEGLDLVAHLDQLLNLGGGVVGQLGYGNVAGVLGAQIHLDLSRRNCYDCASDLIPRIQSFDRILQHISEGFLDLHDFIAHFVTNLLYYPRGSRSTRRDADNFCLGQPAQIQV